MPAVPHATAASSAVTSAPHSQTPSAASTSWASDDHFIASKDSLLQSERTSTRKLSKSPTPTVSSIASVQRPHIRKSQISSRSSRTEDSTSPQDTVRVCPRPARLSNTVSTAPKTQTQLHRHSAPAQKITRDSKTEASIGKRPKSQSPAKGNRSVASTVGVTGSKAAGRRTTASQASCASSPPSTNPATPTSEAPSRHRTPPTLTKVAARVVVKAVRNAIFPPKDNPFVGPSEQQTPMDGDTAEYEVSVEQVNEIDESRTELPEKKTVKPFVFKTAPTRSCGAGTAPAIPVAVANISGIPSALAPTAIPAITAVLTSVSSHKAHRVVSFDAEEDFERELGYEEPDEDAELDDYELGVLEGEDEDDADDESEFIEEREQAETVPEDDAREDEDEDEDEKVAPGMHFLEILHKESKRLSKLVDRADWELRDADHLPEHAQEKLRAATGQGRLLITKKLKQFEGLCRRNVAFHDAQKWGRNARNRSQTPSPTSLRGQDALPITAQDLAGFWDMVKLQVDHVDRMFSELDNLRRNCWMERGSTRLLATSSGSSGSSASSANPRLYSAGTTTSTPTTSGAIATDRPFPGMGSTPRMASRSASSGRRRPTTLVAARVSAPHSGSPSVSSRLAQSPAHCGPTVKDPTVPRDSGRRRLRSNDGCL